MRAPSNIDAEPHYTDLLKEPLAEGGLQPRFFSLTDFLFPKAERKAEDFVSAEVLVAEGDGKKLISRMIRLNPGVNIGLVFDRGEGRLSTGYAIVEILAARSVVEKFKATFERVCGLPTSA
jgi:hypothetical protein